MNLTPFTEADAAVVAEQLGRVPRGTVGVAWRNAQGEPGVVATAPRLPDGTPFPTTYYLTDPALSHAIGTLEASGLMAEMSQRLLDDEDLAAAHRRAHEAYLADRAEIGRLAGVSDVPEIEGISAGGYPTRVKCLHVLIGHALAAGPGVTPLGDEALAMARQLMHTTEGE